MWQEKKFETGLQYNYLHEFFFFLPKCATKQTANSNANIKVQGLYSQTILTATVPAFGNTLAATCLGDLKYSHSQQSFLQSENSPNHLR